MSDEQYAAHRYGRATKDKENYISKSDPQWPTRSAEAIRKALNHEKSPFATDAELGFLADQLFPESDKLYNLQALNSAKVAQTAWEMFRRGQIGRSMPALAAYRDGEAQHPDHDFSLLAFQVRVYEKIRELDWDPVNSQDVADVMDSLIKDPNEKVPLSDEGQRNEEAQQTTSRFNRLIQNITRGKDKFPRWSPQHGKIVNVNSSTLQNLTISELEALDKEITTLRQQRNDEDRQQQNDRLRDVADENRGYKVFRPGDKDQLGGEIKYADDTKGTNKFEFVGEAPTQSKPTTGKMDRSAPLANPSEDVLFTSPVTGMQYSKKEAYALAGGSEVDRRLFRKMMNTNLARLNSILAGN